ncbi:MAG TPA: aminopeptidase [Syntrophorhabdaceae bacterium]|nr:aminopeptidase [Syntrophorhabdaceae bacterium]
MLTEKQLAQYAEVLLWGLGTARKKPFKKNDCILLQYEAPAVRLAEILYGRILDLGMHPVQRMGLTFGMEKSLYKRSNKRQLTFLAPGDRELYANLNGRIFLRAPESLTHLKEIDPAKIGTVLVSRKPLRDILDKREEKGLYSWTLCTFPTNELARQAKARPEEYARQIVRACYLDRKDPVGEWKNVHRQVSGIKRWLNSLEVSYFHVESDHVDLKVTPGEKRAWKGISGHNIPSFEVFLSPDWHGTEGVYYANLPSFRSGNYVEKIRITFRKGSVVKMEAGKGEDFARKQLSMDKGASRVGEFSLTDRRFSRIDRFMADTLFDENFGGQNGNCHIALGASYTDTYDGNPAAMTGALKKRLGFNESALHWDLVNTEDKTVTACLRSGKKVVIYEKGVFKY